MIRLLWDFLYKNAVYAGFVNANFPEKPLFFEIFVHFSFHCDVF